MRIWSERVRAGGLPVVLSGPSGVGKDAVLTELARIQPSVRRCVTCTTRQRRDGETDGVDYIFISVDEFRRRVAEGGFIEHAEVYGNLYGTPRQWVEERLSLGEDVVLKVDVQGGLNAKRVMPGAVMVFLVPPSMEELERRLRARNSDSEESLATRLRNAANELDQIPHYDYIIENDIVAKAAEELRAVIIAEHCRIQ